MLDLAPERAISWVIATPGHDASLLGRVNAFFSADRTEGLIAAVLDRYYGAGDAFDYLLSRNFMEHVQTRLPKYVEWFQQACYIPGPPSMELRAPSWQRFDAVTP